MINFVRGNLFDDLSTAHYAVNTVNCNGVMGKGIALGFKQRFPDMFAWYKKICDQRDFRPGDVKPYVPNGNLIIYNMATKDNWWDASQYEWIEAGLSNLNDWITYNNDYPAMKLLLPPPGCGNGGLQWGIVKPMVKKFLKDLNCEVRVYEPN